MADIFEEVESDLRAERARALLQRYGKLGIAAVVLIVLGVAAWQGLAWLRARQMARVAMEYFAAAQESQATTPAGSGNTKAEADFARLAGNNTPAGYRALARLRTAALAAGAGQKTLALKLWREVAEDSDADPLLQDLGRLLWVTHQIDGVKSATAAKPLEAELHPLLAAGNPWRPLAEEASALIALAVGDKGAAQKTLTALDGDPMAPEGVRRRAAALLARISE
ncbi:MAG TPA: tetratricopeptide repeat protein [Acetobacteraceae bacterium]|nr:tetratricopeptide repeat protein [Acetobacteraceae bacterium]